MKTKEEIRIAFLMTAALLLVTASVTAQIREGLFQIELYSQESIDWDRSLNSGFQSTWYNYPQSQTTQLMPWWNEWFWNDPYIPGGKWVQVSFDYKLINPDQPGDVFVTVNWTNGQWVGLAEPPTWQNTANPEVFIERLTDYDVNWTFHLDPDPGNPGARWDSGKFWLPIKYNPEWVSVDVQGMGNVGIWNGVILHECVPEPATLILLVGGGLFMIRMKKT
jgi:hypothetical protein